MIKKNRLELLLIEEVSRLKILTFYEFLKKKLEKWDKKAEIYITKKVERFGISNIEAIHSLSDYNHKYYDKEGNNIWVQGIKWRIRYGLFNREKCDYCGGQIKNDNCKCHHKIYDFKRIFSETRLVHNEENGNCHNKVHNGDENDGKNRLNVEIFNKNIDNYFSDFLRRKVAKYDYKAKRYMKDNASSNLSLYRCWVSMKNHQNFEGFFVLKKGIKWLYLQRLYNNNVFCLICNEIVYIGDSRMHHVFYPPDVYDYIFTSSFICHAKCHKDYHRTKNMITKIKIQSGTELSFDSSQTKKLRSEQELERPKKEGRLLGDFF